ncbi:NADH-quinone oxidoreductase subunit C [Streptomyces sp. DW26H14]|uniref:NADH-quinone oxidoreductase subunit D-related protein n=1 Tax=Streptomyces sp. DW26H14 TaxID=3435395 RepID=UPI00403E1A8C
MSTPMSHASSAPLPEPEEWRGLVLAACTGEDAARFGGVFGIGEEARGVRLLAVLFPRDTEEPTILQTRLKPDDLSYQSLSTELAAAFWYERILHDLFGVTPLGHPRPDPLLLPLSDPRHAPLPGTTRRPPPLEPDESAVPRAVTGPGIFTMPHGPVRSGVFESVEYLVETPGEDIPRVQIRVFHKHRGLSKSFEQLTPDDGTLLAERAEGIASVAHALAFCHAVERCAQVDVPWPARLTRAFFAELERIANHLDVMIKLTEAAGLAVATARFGLHKERTMRLAGRCSHSRFSRGVVVPGGVHALPELKPSAIAPELGRLHKAITDDWGAAMATPSFLDRLRGTGRLAPALARSHGALGPVGKASGCSTDARYERPYDAYTALGLGPLPRHSEGDVMARTRVRGTELRQSFQLLAQILEELRTVDSDDSLRHDLPAGVTGESAGWAEAPQGEVLYLLRMEEGRIVRCAPRSASLHNLVLFHEVFGGDILTDFPFVEASFGLSIAGVAV